MNKKSKPNLVKRAITTGSINALINGEPNIFLKR